MIVCHCERIPSAAVEAAISAGASCVDEVTGMCRAGGRCGSCWQSIEDLLDEVAGRRSSQPVPAVA